MLFLKIWEIQVQKSANLSRQKNVRKVYSSLAASVADPGCLSRIPDPKFYPSRIPDPKTATKREVKKN
jgi:hypothetical protein